MDRTSFKRELSDRIAAIGRWLADNSDSIAIESIESIGMTSMKIEIDVMEKGQFTFGGVQFIEVIQGNAYEVFPIERPS